MFVGLDIRIFPERSVIVWPGVKAKEPGISADNDISTTTIFWAGN